MTVMTAKKCKNYSYNEWVSYIESLPKQARWNRWVCIDFMISMNGFVDADDMQNIKRLWKDNLID